jgi:hypothetical protein
LAVVLVTQFVNARGASLSKAISLDEDGRLCIDSSACVMVEGKAYRVDVADVAELAAMIGDMPVNSALALGALRADLSDECEVVTTERLAKLNGGGDANTIARTSDAIRFERGQSAFALCDYDGKGMPVSTLTFIRKKGSGSYRDTLATIIPEIGRCAAVERSSTSAGLYKVDTGEPLPGSGGRHLYLQVVNGADIPRFLQVLHQRCWLAGFGWGMCAKNGAFLERSVVDRAVAAGEHLVFEGGPQVNGGVGQDPEQRRPTVIEGEVLDTEKACRPLTIEELREYRERVAFERRRLEPEATRLRAEFIEERTKTLVARGIPEAKARAAVARQCEGVLRPEIELEFDDAAIGLRTVGEVLADLPRFMGLTLADPIEGRPYGKCKAKVLRRRDGTPYINSFAHGGARYLLRYDYDAAEAEMANAAPEHVVETLVTLAPQIDADPMEIERLEKLAKENQHPEVSLPTIKKMVKEARKGVEKEDAEGAEGGFGGVGGTGALGSVGGIARDPVIAGLNEEYGYVVSGDKSAVIWEHVDEKGIPIFNLLLPNTFHEKLANYTLTIPVENAKGEIVAKQIQASEYWFRHEDRRQYDGVVFTPSESVSTRHYNLWNGWAVKPIRGDCGRFLEHLYENACQRNQAYFDWVLAWFADIFQNPTDKKGTSLVFRGDVGVGKTIIGKYLRALLGFHYVLANDPRYVLGQFNSHIVRCLLLHADEAFWAGDKKSEGKLKDLVTGDLQYIEYKFREAFPVANHVRLMVSGNPDWLVPASLKERRFATFDFGTKHQKDYSYFAQIDREMRTGGAEALLYHLLDLNIVPNLREIPVTQTLMDQKMASMSSEQSWWYGVLRDGMLPGDFDGGGEVYKDLLYDSYVDGARKSGASRRSYQVQLGYFLQKVVGGVSFGLRTQDTDIVLWKVTGRQPEKFALRRKWCFPTLEECRRAFSAMCPGLPEWSEPKTWQKDKNYSPREPIPPSAGGYGWNKT